MNQDIIQRIREIMACFKYNISKLSHRLNISQSNMSAILSGKRSIGVNMINRISSSLGINEVWLTTGIGAMFNIDPDGIGRRMQIIRDDIGMTASQVAVALNIPEKTLNDIESGTTIPDEDIVRKFIELSEADPAWVFRGIGKKIEGPYHLTAIMNFSGQPTTNITSKKAFLETDSSSANESDISERILNIIYDLYNKDIEKVAKESHISIDRLNEIVSGKSPTNLEAYQISKLKQVNPDWLFTGKGEMLNIDTNSFDNYVSYKLVPLLNLDAVGGMHSLNTIDGTEYTEKLIPFTDAQEGDVALVVSGNSMDPTCPAGSKVLLREVVNWNEYFGFGNIFVIHLTDNRRILKEVQKFPEDPKNYVLCKSHNDKYPEEELPKSMIKSVWKVVKILNERGW
ncbi:helix-turn-helix domain-containing protein [uncultured Bacteroides sp.]|uniref:helix-turn-helix domain-containing protein n=1 Tax=uncultured Bacteroides sp. TaxID=162156 RepID=UPI0025DF592F|nr:helix-turn-helix domain-containing protein [uncultured Bacteroides sp.]